MYMCVYLRESVSVQSGEHLMAGLCPPSGSGAGSLPSELGYNERISGALMRL